MRPAQHAQPPSSQVRFTVEPRLVPPVKAARRLHLTLSDFNAKREALYRDGFPRSCTVTGHYDLVAIDVWLDQRSHLGQQGSDPRAEQDFMLARIAELG